MYFYEKMAQVTVVLKNDKGATILEKKADLLLADSGSDVLILCLSDNQNDFSFNHSFGVEYRFFNNLLLEFEYDRETLFYTPLYMEKPYLEDFKVRLRHSFSF